MLCSHTTTTTTTTTSSAVASSCPIQRPRMYGPWLPELTFKQTRIAIEWYGLE